ncbi:MAG: tRNA (N6-threonylcarbamoyladenosine(37)-N6)-methyltransferase TrmO [Clostridia bacterium]|nr:tRNA (N6-threonylcarbamoyladenosine(37)-N6)-methyltransferase TrmO [Clostridia bacterium]
MSELVMRPIAHIRTDFPTKFGVPRQSGLVEALEATVVFEPEYRNADALRGLEGYSHVWLIWQFSEAVRETWSPTVRPPRLGGNTRMGVFATRSPFRPNAIGLSSVKLERIEQTDEGAVLVVSGADLMNGTPILDIKPYLPFTDSHPDATGGFAEPVRDYALEVTCDPEILAAFSPTQQAALLGVLAQDPRPSYQDDPDRIYGLPFAGKDVKFTVNGTQLTVIGME